MSVVDVQVAGLAANPLIDLDDGTEEVLHAFAALERRGHHRHTEKGAECLHIDVVATPLELVVHIQGTHHTQVHIEELCGEVEVALKVAGINDIDDHVGHLLLQVFADIKLLGRIAGQGIGAGQVNEIELIAEHRGMGLGGVDGDAAVVAHTSVGSAGKIEERRLTAVGIAYERHIDGTALAEGMVKSRPNRPSPGPSL